LRDTGAECQPALLTVVHDPELLVLKLSRFTFAVWIQIDAPRILFPASEADATPILSFVDAALVVT
jgi:hypothetical protein